MSDQETRETSGKPAFYSSEDGEYFWVRATCTADEARALVEATHGKIDFSEVHLVHGFEHTKHGEPWFTKTAKGVEFWELVND